MTDAVTLTARRTFWGTFPRMAELWFSGPSGYISTLVIIALFTFAFSNGAPMWLAVIGGLAWVAMMLPFLFAMQSWITIRHAREAGLPVFTFDKEGAGCKSGKLEARAPWSGINRVRLTRRTCFVYVTKRSVWFFGRGELTSSEETALLAFVRASDVKLQGI